MTSVERPEWTVQAPVGGWATPWPQAAELANAIPSDQWTLIGGLMVQLHAAKAGVPLNRPTLDVDIVLHIETGAAVFNEVKNNSRISATNSAGRSRTTTPSTGLHVEEKRPPR